MKRLLISGTNSGCGKTTIACAVLSALKERGMSPTSFKCGPDYIDPMFHRAVTGIPAYNLDPFFLDSGGIRSHLALRAGVISVIEGAMGYYDGIAASDNASAYTVAQGTDTPAVLVVDARGAGNSLGAVIEGFLRYRPESRVEGVIFNNAGGHRYPDLVRIASGAGVLAYGYMPRGDEWTIPSRHLGLYTAGEIENISEKLLELGRQAERSLDIEGLIELAGRAPLLEAARRPESTRTNTARLAVARDAAFCFMYEENIELLRSLGCEIIFFSPLRDNTLPQGISGLYLCGGYPELYAKELSENMPMLSSIRGAISGGLPTIAECGGFMYLLDKIGDFPMCGVIEGRAFKTDRLQRFGYITLTARRDNMLCRAGESIRSHEFHYWDSTNTGDSFTAQKAGRGNSYDCIIATDSMYAGFGHLFLPANPVFASNFVERMVRYGR